MDPNEPIEPEIEQKSNIVEFPIKTPARPPAPKFRRGDWVRYYEEANKLSIAQIEYLAVRDKVIMLFTDRGVVPESSVVEIRKISND